MITDYAQMTVKLRSLMNNEEAKTAINKALSKYPLYEGKKKYDLIPTREQLNERLLNNYKDREIGFETVGRFLEELEITMCEIMPYYNELLKTVEIMADLENPFDNVDVTETFEEQRTEKTETEGSTTGEHGTTTNASATSVVEGEGSSNETKNRKFSDTPQNNISNINNYLTDYTEEEANGTSTSKTEGNDESESTTTSNDSVTNTGESNVTGTTTHTYTKKGNQGVNTYAHDMIEFRTSIRDIVNEIVNDYRIQNLFMLIW